MWTALAIWYVAYIATLEFFRFKFGLYKISLAYLLIGTPLVWLLSRPRKAKSEAGHLPHTKK
jgi:hypothetical protein